MKLGGPPPRPMEPPRPWKKVICTPCFLPTCQSRPYQTHMFCTQKRQKVLEPLHEGDNYSPYMSTKKYLERLMTGYTSPCPTEEPTCCPLCLEVKAGDYCPRLQGLGRDLEDHPIENWSATSVAGICHRHDTTEGPLAALAALAPDLQQVLHGTVQFPGRGELSSQMW